MTQIRQISPEVFQSDGRFLAAGPDMLDLLKEKALISPRKRCRLCFHAGPDAAQQEMLIVMNRASYVRPHRHFGKTETLGMIEGECDTLLFDENGNVTDVIPMTVPGQGGAFFYRMPEGIFHTLNFRSEWVCFVETTIGPFDPARTEPASWAPPETSPAEGHALIASYLAS